MKIAIYRHRSGCCFIPETIEPSRVLGDRFSTSVVCRNTSLEELIHAGLTDTAELIISRTYLDLPIDVGDEVLQRLSQSRTIVNVG